MKALVVYYSRTGITQNLAENIAKNLNADMDEIKDKKSRSGLFGWFGAGKDAVLKKETEIEYDADPENYDVVIIGSPVWAGNITPAVRTYLNKFTFQKVAFFATYGGSEGKVFENLEKYSSRPLDKIGIKMKDVKLANMKQKVERFCKNIKEHF
ncbi:MAG: flavodoxin [Candidatus Mcinerneyibacterium aminivorans]|jgi:flavodoxin|uniref:Flavodoxin n=1 Tax=Candidatus Mcinerneyibacterium aminivorans TaxID=2703815 RepID=A0A5D0MDR2_9BACT|nr:MAG: flavodoxin [Candidatus Mcinerneyibacterium aminivorans]